MSSKTEFVAVLCEEPKKELPTNDASISSSHEFFLHKRRSAIRRAILFILVLFLGGRFLFAGLFYFLFSGCSHALDGIKVEVQNEQSSCEASIRWNGPGGFLLDPNDVTGLVFNVKGMSAYGSITIRQDSQDKDFINITNKIYLSEESLQTEVNIKVNVIDEDYSITIETPSFDGPRPTTKCVIVDTIITLPSNLSLFRSLVVDAPNSWISTEGLGSVDFAYVSLKTRNGHIVVKDFSAAIAEIATVNGHVQGSFVVSESLEVRTVNGAIGINVIANARAEDISLTSKSINGHLDISVRDLTDAQTISFRAGSINGGVIANLPDVYTGNFSVTTTIGRAYVGGHDITYIKNTGNAKVGYKNKEDGSHVFVEAVTGSVELYFL